jgi:hypothetical protein
MTDTTGDKIIKAREDERKRIMATKPMLTTKLGIEGGIPLPTLEIRIVGGDPAKLQELGLRLQGIVLDAIPTLVIPDALEH